MNGWTIVKVLCAVVVVGACGLIGKGFAESCVRRERLYGQLMSFLNFMETESGYLNATILDAARECLTRQNMPVSLCRALCSELERGERASFNDCWVHACTEWLGEHGGEYSLSGDDREVIRYLMLNVFEGGEKERAKQFQTARFRLDERRKAASAEKVTNQKLYGKLGFLIGAAIVILIL